jgi:putative hemolysin
MSEVLLEEYALFFFGLVFSGFFSGSEAVLMSIPIDRVKQLIEGGGRKGRTFEDMVNKPTQLLTTILVGNNIVNIFVASLATAIATRIFKSDAIAVSVGVTTAFILIFGEIIPKTLSRSKAEVLAYPTVFTLRIFYFILFPIVAPLTYTIERVFGKNAQIRGKLITKRDIEFMVGQAEKEKSIDSQQIELLNSILEFPKIKVKDIMIPRNKIYGVEEQATFDEVIKLVREVAHSRYPVFSSSLDNVTGFLHVKDLAFVKPEDQAKFKAVEYLKEPFFVFENMKINMVFDHMNRKKVHLAMVKDENSLVVGIVTLEDIMEEIFGEIQDEHDTEEDFASKNDNKPLGSEGIIIPGDISLRDLSSEYGIRIPLNDNYSTLTGFILDMIENNFPKEGQVILFERYFFELTKVNDSEILDVTMKVLEESAQISYSLEEINSKEDAQVHS